MMNHAFHFPKISTHLMETNLNLLLLTCLPSGAKRRHNLFGLLYKFFTFPAFTINKMEV